MSFYIFQDAFGSTNQLAVGGSGAAENGMMPPPQIAYVHHGERARAMSASGKVTHTHSCTCIYVRTLINIMHSLGLPLEINA